MAWPRAARRRWSWLGSQRDEMALLAQWAPAWRALAGVHDRGSTDQTAERIDDLSMRQRTADAAIDLNSLRLAHNPAFLARHASTARVFRLTTSYISSSPALPTESSLPG